MRRVRVSELTCSALVVGYLLGAIICMSIGYASLIQGFSIDNRRTIVWRVDHSAEPAQARQFDEVLAGSKTAPVTIGTGELMLSRVTCSTAGWIATGRLFSQCETECNSVCAQKPRKWFILTSARTW